MATWLEHFRQNRARRAGRKADKKEEAGFLQQWFLLCGPDADPAAPPSPESLRPLYPPADRFWADPFLWEEQGRYYIFFEDFPYATWRGLISVIEVDAQGRAMGPAVPVIEEPYHLSYPFLFRHDGQLYMVPEKTEVKRVDLYRCVEFPHQWEIDRTLINDLKMADSTLFEQEGRWWLFGSAKTGRTRINESLFAFHADSPLSTDWTPHPGNPLVRSLANGRCAGTITPDGRGGWLRPSQDCVRRYGHGLNINRILTLTPTTYREETVWHRSGPEVNPEWRAMHHVDRKHGLVVMDAQRLIPRPSAGEPA
ncbi:MAG TPA: hypothetical protein VFW42_08730 [Fluviicoccus sp.]|nr:hypothetical protein [Fluviicoccus sp.]